MARAALEAETTWGNDTPALVSWTCRSALESYRQLLFPVYLVTTRHANRVRQIVVNGINGDIAAQTPVSPWKVGIPIAAVAVLGLALPWIKDALG
jgi:hypothetical protein